jgi:catechol 2,3-dioxygenase-like lactoylglutathione lyase family enzyme
VLGAELVERGGGPARHYRIGDHQLNVHGPGTKPHPVALHPAQPGGADLEEGPVERFGARGAGTSVYFRDPDGSLLEFISYD